jgi:hypothetical protein
LGIGYTIVKASIQQEKQGRQNWKPVIKPASPEEIAMCDEQMKDYEKNPSSFVPFKRRKKRIAYRTGYHLDRQPSYSVI